jgi:glycosyltransferase involved in cell wall biosynthesis
LRLSSTRGKLWLFGRAWLGGVPEFVVFHNRKIGDRLRFRNWLALSESHRRELHLLAHQSHIERPIALIRNGPLPPTTKLSPHPGPICSLGTLGRFNEMKDVALLVAAFADVVADRPDFRLVIGGDGPERARCERLAREIGVAPRISWLGWLDDPIDFYRAVDLFCLPSRDKQFGIVLLEAMQFGLSVFATDTYGPRDIIVPDVTGWLVPIGN